MKLTKLFAPVLGSFVLVVSVAVLAQLQPPRTIPTTGLSTTTTPTTIATSAPTVFPTTVAKATATPTQTIKKSSCIITVNGKRYDVQPLKKSHSGGDVFVCGSDMTKMFNQQHGTKYELIAKYRI